MKKKRNLIGWAFAIPLAFLFTANLPGCLKSRQCVTITHPTEYHFDRTSEGYIIYTEDMKEVGRLKHGDNRTLDSLVDKDNQPVYVEYFKMYDTIYPSYACIDTMIVFDAVGFNKDMALVEQGIIDATDSQLDSITHLRCRKINNY